MSNLEVYFSNHDKAMRFPWSIYHRPLLEDLEFFLKSYLRPQMKILVIGPGEFQEFKIIQSFGPEISLLDIDPRVIEGKLSQLGSQIKSSYIVDENFNGYPIDESFDLIYAKEVVEHLPNYDRFIKKLHDVLRPGGKIWLSTPNYGFFLLPLVESTILEAIARCSGFSRREIHPSRFDAKKLNEAVLSAGFSNVKVNETFMKLALTVTGSKVSNN